MRDHEGDDLGSNLLRRRDEVALVLAILVIHDDDDAAVPQRLQCVFDLGVFLTHRHVLILKPWRAKLPVGTPTAAALLVSLPLFYTNRPVQAQAQIAVMQDGLP